MTCMEVKYRGTYKSEARASPPGLSIRMIAALYLFDSKGKEKVEKENQDDWKNNLTVQIASS